MKRLPTLFMTLACALVFGLLACTHDPDPVPQYRIGLVSGLGGFSDRGFNHNILAGYQRAATDYPFLTGTYACSGSQDFALGIDYFVRGGYSMIITAGFNAAEATLAAALAHPDIRFVILDYALANPPSNLQCTVFDVDQAAFPCGFLAAWWADSHRAESPLAGYVAGPDIPEIRQFAVGYTHGIAYYNSRYLRTVQHRGYNATVFTDTLEGARLADSLIRDGASVLFAFAGRTGNGALYRAQEAGIPAIGVDVDQALSIPEVAPSLLTSCMKALDVMVYDILKSYVQFGAFYGGTTVHGNLSNHGVGLAPFHAFEAAVPDSIKADLEVLYTGIKNGTIPTGWPENR